MRARCGRLCIRRSISKEVEKRIPQLGKANDGDLAKSEPHCIYYHPPMMINNTEIVLKNQKEITLLPMGNSFNFFSIFMCW